MIQYYVLGTQIKMFSSYPNNLEIFTPPWRCFPNCSSKREPITPVFSCHSSFNVLSSEMVPQPFFVSSDIDIFVKHKQLACGFSLYLDFADSFLMIKFWLYTFGRQCCLNDVVSFSSSYQETCDTSLSC